MRLTTPTCFALLFLIAFAPAVKSETTWSQFRVGSWTRTHCMVLAPADSSSGWVTTRLQQSDSHRVWFDHTDSLGRVTDDGSGNIGAFELLNPLPARSDSLVRRETLMIDGRRVRCDVWMRTWVGSPLCGNDPVDFTLSHDWRWISTDGGTRGLMVQWTFGYSEEHDHAGRVTMSGDSTTWRVERWHDVQWVRGKRVDCRVASVQPFEIDGARGRVTVWTVPDLPVSVLQVYEGVHQGRGVPVHMEWRLVDYGLTRK